MSEGKTNEAPKAENLSEDEKVLHRIQSEFNEELKTLMKTEEQINSLVPKIQFKFFELAKVRCSDTYKWLTKEGEPEVSNNGIKFNITAEMEKDAPKQFTELSKCIQKFDNGYQKEMMFLMKKSQLVGREYENCMKRCAESKDEKADCFRNCIRRSFDISSEIQQAILKKSNDTLHKLNI